MASVTNRNHHFLSSHAHSVSSVMDRILAARPLLFLSGLAVASTLIYGFGFVPIANLFALYKTPHLNLYTLPQGGTPGLLRLVLAFSALALIYGLGWRLARNLQGKAAWMVILGGSLGSGLALMLLYPFGATDLFDNILRGRILGIYGGNPFLPGTVRYATDPFYSYIGWKGWPSAYGPGWEFTSSLVARLAGNGVIANVLAYKALPGVFLLASVGVVALILREIAPHQALANTLLLAWNPIVLFETWGNGHNDMAMVFWMLLAALAAVKRRYTLAVLALVAGALFKFIPVLLIPPVLVLALRAQPTLRQRFILLAKTALLSVFLISIAYAPFWTGIKVLNIQSRENLYTSSLPSTIYNILLVANWTKKEAAALVSRAALVLTVAFTLWKSWRVWKIPTFQQAIQSAAQILLFYLLVTCLWFQNWYSLWPMGLVPLLKPGPTRRLAVLVSFLTLSKPLGIGPLLFWPQPKLEQPWLEILFTLGVLGAPWLYSMLMIWKANHERVTA